MANKILAVQETAITFTDDTTGGTYTLDIGGLAAGAVRVSDQADLGITASVRKTTLYRWSFVVDGFDTAPIVDELVDVYLAYGRSTSDIDGDLASTDGASSTVVLPNLHHIGSAVVQTTTAANELRISSREPLEILSRYVSVVVHNNTADALLSTSDAHTFTLTPISIEVQ